MFLMPIMIVSIFIGATARENPRTFGERLTTAPSKTNYRCFRTLGTSFYGELGARRLFGGTPAELHEFPYICSLMDRKYFVRCSCTIITPFWVLTAGHCITPKLHLVKYNTKWPAAASGDDAHISSLFQHPSYRIYEDYTDKARDVTMLHHDIGLVKTKRAMDVSPKLDFIGKFQMYEPSNLNNEEVKVLGFGKTAARSLGEELFSTTLQLVECERAEWTHCICGKAPSDHPRGVCSGDSGGPVVYKDTLIGVTSMGPIECAEKDATPTPTATSVFTSLYQYAAVINDTIFDKENTLRMSPMSDSGTFCKCLHSLLLNGLILTTMQNTM